MDFIISTIRTLLRHLWMILVGTALFTLFVIYYTRHMVGGYEVKATLYTGVASGYNLESDKRTDWAMVQNSMDNLISIMQAESTQPSLLIWRTLICEVAIAYNSIIFFLISSYFTSRSSSALRSVSLCRLTRPLRSNRSSKGMLKPAPIV